MTRYLRKVVRIEATDSPNVQLHLAKVAAGIACDNEVVTPGVLSANQWRHRERTWDEVLKCIGLRARFYQGAAALLYPPEWLNRAASYAWAWRGRKRDGRKFVGVDPGEGRANTAMALGDEWGLLELRSRPTADTSVIRREVAALLREWSVRPEDCLFDAGGGGKQIADEMCSDGLHVRAVGFGESALLPIRRGGASLDERREVREEKAAYVNRRAQMYGELAGLIDPGRQGPDGRERPYALGPLRDNHVELEELRRQLAVIPRQYDKEGRLWLPPKHRSPGVLAGVKTMVDLIGKSPDEADAVALMTHAMLHPAARSAGPMAGWEKRLDGVGAGLE